jgi:hypothetical protein
MDLLYLLIIPALLAARILWTRKPGLLTCGLFWGSPLVLVTLGFEVVPSQFLLVGGLACNALVTLANGGYMPVRAQWRQRGPARSLWVQRTSGQHLLFLADNFGNRWIRFSVGDVLIAAGIVLSIAGY